ncbi:MAG: hypothetical protein CNLJKLNK_00148 [Holosporales bacterium]
MNQFFKRIGIEKIFPLCIILFLFVLLLIYNENKKTILILHSYYNDYSWVQNVNDGLDKVLARKDLYRIQYHYMDTKRHPNKEFVERAGNTARQVINQLKPDIIIAVDDDAQQYVAKHYVNAPGISIIFSGVNGLAEKYGYVGSENVTGILERIPLDGLRDVLNIIAEKKKMKQIRIAHISDTSETVSLDDNYFHDFKDWGRIKIKPSKLVCTFQEWKKAILDADKEMDFIIISNYRKISRSTEDPKLVPPEEIMAWTVENATIPIIGVNSFVVTDGGYLAIATSPYEQGEVAAKQALAILEEGKKARDIPFQKTEQFIVYIRKDKDKKEHEAHTHKGFESLAEDVLPEVYRAFSKATNKYIEG